jgi:putative transcriptional regulator
MKAVFIELPAFERHRSDYLDDDSLGCGCEENFVKKKRELFEELNEGLDALADHRTGKRTLRTHAVKTRPVPKITARELTKVRQDMNLSRGVFAGYLRLNVRTLENWEQGRAKPNAQAALLIRLVQRFPDTVRRLAEI